MKVAGSQKSSALTQKLAGLGCVIRNLVVGDHILSIYLISVVCSSGNVALIITDYYPNSASASRTRSMVASMSASVWAVETKPASNWEGAV